MKSLTKEMMLMITASLLLMTLKTPMVTAVLIISTSLMVAKETYTSMGNSWLPLVTILVFSSGMMTLFMYAASLAPNEKKSTKKSKMFLAILFAIPMSTMMKNTPKNKSMSNFSSSTMMLIMMSFLILTMVTIISQSSHPSLTISTSF